MQGGVCALIGTWVSNKVLLMPLQRPDAAEDGSCNSDPAAVGQPNNAALVPLLRLPQGTPRSLLVGRSYDQDLRLHAASSVSQHADCFPQGRVSELLHLQVHQLDPGGAHILFVGSSSGEVVFCAVQSGGDSGSMWLGEPGTCIPCFHGGVPSLTVQQTGATLTNQECEMGSLGPAAGEGRVVQAGLDEVRLVSVPAGVLAVSDQMLLLRHSPNSDTSGTRPGALCIADVVRACPEAATSAVSMHATTHGAALDSSLSDCTRMFDVLGMKFRCRVTSFTSGCLCCRMPYSDCGRPAGACQRLGDSSCGPGLCSSAQWARLAVRWVQWCQCTWPVR